MASRDFEERGFDRLSLSLSLSHTHTHTVIIHVDCVIPAIIYWFTYIFFNTRKLTRKTR